VYSAAEAVDGEEEARDDEEPAECVAQRGSRDVVGPTAACGAAREETDGESASNGPVDVAERPVSDQGRHRPRVVVEPEDFARALDADPAARAAYDRLSHSRKREHVLTIEGAEKAETRTRRIETALATLRTSTPGKR